MISHVTIRTPLLQQTVDFYQWLLDMPIAKEMHSPMAGRIVFLGNSKASLELIEDENAEPINAPCLSIGVMVDDLDAKLAMLDSRGIPHSGILSPVPQVRFAFFADLNGCHIQLMEQREGAQSH